MGCASCGSGGTDKNGKPLGCNSNGGCATGGCNKMNTFDWLTAIDLKEQVENEIVEVSFKNGSRKAFFNNPPFTRTSTGDMVVVETGNGLDVGKISLSGELVRLQMKKRRVPVDAELNNVVRLASPRDLDRLTEARNIEMNTLVRARVISRNLGLEMKMGDIEYQGDLRKATFYYTADGRVDFRELIRIFAQEFRVKIEMRQIGARQESARIGGLGSCGRELCCSTWLSNFKSVSTSAARYQNLAINQAKLSGQCGRLKCCLNYELDTYMDALEDFPKNAESLYTEAGQATLVKTNIFKKLLFYAYRNDQFKGKLYVLGVDQVKEILEMNAKGKKPMDLMSYQMENAPAEEGTSYDAEDLTGVIELPPEERKRRNKRGRGKDGGRKRNPKNRQGGGNKRGPKPDRKSGDKKDSNNKPNNRNKKQGGPENNAGPKDGNKPKRRKPHKRNRPNKGGNKPPEGDNKGPKKDGGDKS